MQSRNSKAHRLSHSQKLNCICMYCTLVAFLFDILKTIKQGGNPEDNRAGKQEVVDHAILIQFPKTSPFDFVLGDWKAQKCLAGTVQGPWGLRKNDIPYSKTSAGMVKHELTLKWNTFLHKQDGAMFQCTVEWIDWVYVDLALLALPPFAKHNAATSTFAKRRLSLVLHVALPNPQRTGSALGRLCVQNFTVARACTVREVVDYSCKL